MHPHVSVSLMKIFLFVILFLLHFLETLTRLTHAHTVSVTMSILHERCDSTNQH